MKTKRLLSIVGLTLLALVIILPQMAAAANWQYTGNLISRDLYDQANLLPNGQVLINGNWNTWFMENAQLYNPVSGIWQTTGVMGTGRDGGATFTLLDSGQVLAAGGVAPNSGGTPLTSAELYDSGTWNPTAPLGTGRSDHTATLLNNGQVLVAGGVNFHDNVYVISAELYDPYALPPTWSATAPLANLRRDHTATRLNDGKVLVVGGWHNGCLASAEIYDPNGAPPTWSSAGFLATARYGHRATLLTSGKVLITGGWDDNGDPLASAEIYDPNAAPQSAWSSAGSLAAARTDHCATRLSNGEVLVTGGGNHSNEYLTSAELYNPRTNTWRPTRPLHTGRYAHVAILLNDHRVLVAGGSTTLDYDITSELYTPWDITGALKLLLLD